MFEDTRPYFDKEIPAAITRVAKHPLLPSIAAYLFPEVPFATFKKKFSEIQTVYDFQHQIMLKAIHKILYKTSSGLSAEGFNQLDQDHRYMFIANHRDILLDAAILQILLDSYQLETSEITFGSNLMKNDISMEIGKMNKMFKLERSGSLLDFYRHAKEVSAYMRYALLEKRQSVWIAQRNGRTKDGIDKTENAVLKMFSISSKKPFVENLAELNITPVAISYEYEPCDFLKTQELYLRQQGPYTKAKNEDLNSILTGITQFKGRIHLCVTQTITNEELEQCNLQNKNLKFQVLASIIDQRLLSSYRLWSTHYIAYDILHESDTYAAKYTESERTQFVTRMEEGLSHLSGSRNELKRIFLGIYANAIKS